MGILRMSGQVWEYSRLPGYTQACLGLSEHVRTSLHENIDGAELEFKFD